MRDLEQRGTAPTVSDIIGATGISSIYQPLLYAAERRFQVLADHRVVLQASDHVKIGTVAWEDNNHIFYLGTSAASTDAAEGNMYLVSTCDESASNPPVVNWHFRFTYVDN